MAEGKAGRKNLQLFDALQGLIRVEQEVPGGKRDDDLLDLEIKGKAPDRRGRAWAGRTGEAHPDVFKGQMPEQAAMQGPDLQLPSGVLLETRHQPGLQARSDQAALRHGHQSGGKDRQDPQK